MMNVWVIIFKRSGIIMNKIVDKINVLIGIVIFLIFNKIVMIGVYNIKIIKLLIVIWINV